MHPKPEGGAPPPVWRRTIAILGLLGLVGGLAVGCALTTISGSGNVVSTPVPAPGFSKIEVGSAFHVSVTHGKNDSVTVRVDDNLVGRLDVGVSGNTLHIGLEPGTSVSDATLEADVTARALNGIGLSGASTVRLAGIFTGDRLDVTMSGASHLNGEMRVTGSSMELSGASNVTLTGSASQLTVKESGASKLAAERLMASDLTIDLSGASSATVFVTGTISAGVSGASALRYRGNPSFTRKDTSGASTIQPA